MAAKAKSHPGKGEGVVAALAPVIGAAIANALRTAIGAAIDFFDGYILAPSTSRGRLGAGERCPRQDSAPCLYEDMIACWRAPVDCPTEPLPLTGVSGAVGRA